MKLVKFLFCSCLEKADYEMECMKFNYVHMAQGICLSSNRAQFLDFDYFRTWEWKGFSHLSFYLFLVSPLLFTPFLYFLLFHSLTSSYIKHIIFAVFDGFFFYLPSLLFSLLSEKKKGERKGKKILFLLSIYFRFHSLLINFSK